uniref:Hematopoietic cell signal transducer n=1 Tax=Oryzias sinensis TaxID=183150 RepID=A0A8C7WWR6_9TELE
RSEKEKNRGRCDNCFELDGWLLGGAIIADVVVTTILMTIIYKCTKKKVADGPGKNKANERKRPFSNSPFMNCLLFNSQQLNHHTRTGGVYSTVQKTG